MPKVEQPTCLGCKEGMPTVPTSIVARGARPAGKRKGWRQCLRSNAWHMPDEEAKAIIERASSEKEAEPTDCPTRSERKPVSTPSKGWPRKGSILEREVRESSNRVLRQAGWAVYDFEQGYRATECRSCGAHIPGAGTRVTKGVGDVMIVGHGLLAWIEYKREGMLPTAPEARFGVVLEANGQHYYTIDRVDQALALCQYVRKHGELPSQDDIGHLYRIRRRNS